MPLNEPTITATCDACGVESCRMDMTALVQDSWDARNAANDLYRQGWLKDGEKTFCEHCRPETDEDDD